MPFNKSFWISTAPPTGWLDEMIRDAREAYERDSVPYLISGDYIRPFAIVKLDKDEKENEKMKAKKCDRCGKLYEFPVNGKNTGAEVRFRYLPVNDESDLSEKKIVEKQTKNIYINSISVDVDICPECRESFKKWWESDGKK